MRPENPDPVHALAAYTTRLHRPTSSAQIVATSAGVNALMLASQLLLGALKPGTNTSCAPVFVQRAGEDKFADGVARLRRALAH